MFLNSKNTERNWALLLGSAHMAEGRKSDFVERFLFETTDRQL